MNDHAMEAPDQLTAAARTEMNDIQREIEAAWDVEAGLREILLNEQYHRFAEEPMSGFDVEEGLAAVLDGDARRGVDDTDVVLQVKASPREIPVTRQSRIDHLETLVPPQENTFDRVRRVGREVTETAALHLLEECNRPGSSKVLVEQLAHTVDCGSRLTVLGDDLADGLVGLNDALRVVSDAAEVVKETYILLVKVQREPDGAPTFGALQTWDRFYELEVEVSRLQQPIKRLFDPSEDTVGSLR
ncbi:hypothetical protein [Micromonospora chalcea]|uniref:hypothetical protein n=1 Tax=Micromonospora chalcea TaxID=1874 RepID=UPI0037CC6DF5